MCGCLLQSSAVHSVATLHLDGSGSAQLMKVTVATCSDCIVVTKSRMVWLSIDHIICSNRCCMLYTLHLFYFLFYIFVSFLRTVQLDFIAGIQLINSTDSNRRSLLPAASFTSFSTLSIAFVCCVHSCVLFISVLRQNHVLKAKMIKLKVYLKVFIVKIKK